MNQKIVTQTTRLWLREMTVSDAVHLYQLNLDPAVIRYTGDVAFKDVDEARAFLEGYAQYRLYGLGRWAVINKGDHAFIGWCGLKYTPATDEYDIGFRFFRQYWGRGLATEAAIACIDLGFNVLHLPAIAGRAMVANKASVRVLEKAGLRRLGNCNFDGQEGLLYAIFNPAL